MHFYAFIIVGVFCGLFLLVSDFTHKIKLDLITLWLCPSLGYYMYNPDCRYAILADNVSHPFNEFLLVFVVCGVVGLFLLAIPILIILKTAMPMQYKLLL